MRNHCIVIGLFVLCSLTAVLGATSCDLKTFTVNTKSIPSNLSNYSLLITNFGEYNIKVTSGNTWQFLVDSSLAVPNIIVTVDEQTHVISMEVDDTTTSYLKTAGSSNLVPSLMVLMSGLALVLGSNKRSWLLFGVFLCFAATSVMAFDACNSIIITYPAEMTETQCLNCDNAPQATRSMATRDTSVCAPIEPTDTPTASPIVPTTPTVQPPIAPTTKPIVPTNPPATQAPATQAPATQAPATQAPATQAPATQQPTTPATPTQPAQGSSNPLTCSNYIQPAPSQYYNDVHMCTTTHLPYTLSLSSNMATLEQQVAQIMALSSYNDPTVYSPTPASSFTDFYASFYPSERLYNNNPTQILIGLSDVTFDMNLISTKLRLPSIYFGMFLAYAMDHFGIDPHFLLAQAGKEAAATMVDPSFTQEFLTCQNSQIASGGCSGQVYDCRATYNVGDPAIQGVTHQGCPAVDNFGIALGPFQIETEGFAQIASVAPHRFWVETATRTAANTPNKTPLYMDSGVIALQSTNIKSLQANFTSHNSDSLAIVGAGLYHHWVHNTLINFPLVNFRSAFNERNSEQQGELAFASILYLYNRGMYSVLNFSSCEPSMDPTSDPNCITSQGFGNYAAQIKNATYSLAQAPTVYDFPIQWNDVEFFIQQLETTYPYQCAFCDLGGAYGNIDWDSLYCEAYNIYEKLATARASHYNAQVQTGISFRYDWRLMMAVIRSYLPGRDIISGPDFAPWSVRANPSTGVIDLAADPGPYAAAPFGGPSWVAPAGTLSSAMESCPGETCTASAVNTPAPSAVNTPAPSASSTTGSSQQQSGGQTQTTSCSPDGTICSSNCAQTYYQCSGGVAYPTQPVPKGTVCYDGAFILAADPRCASS